MAIWLNDGISDGERASAGSGGSSGAGGETLPPRSATFGNGRWQI